MFWVNVGSSASAFKKAGVCRYFSTPTINGRPLRDLLLLQGSSMLFALSNGYFEQSDGPHIQKMSNLLSNRTCNTCRFSLMVYETE